MKPSALLTALALATAALAVGCSAGNAPPSAPPASPAPDAPAEPVAEEAEPEPEPDPGPGPLELLQAESRLRLPLVDLAHLATRSHQGAMRIDLGTAGARKHVNGGWRTGFSAAPRTHDGESCYEADSRTARVLFSHPGPATVVVRMKAPKKKNVVTAYIGDTALGTVDISGEMADYTFEVPAEARRAGEQELMLRLKYKTTLDGRRQSAQIAHVTVLGEGASPSDAPTGDAVARLRVGEVERKAVLAASPQTWTWRLFVPDAEGPRLGLAWMARQPGAHLEVTADSDLQDAQTLMDVEVAKDQAGRWVEASMDLSAFRGQVVELSMRAGGTFGEGQLVAFGDAGLWTKPHQDEAKAPPKESPPAKHLVFYLIDTMRYDKFEVYNPERAIETPNINAFAKDATIFDAAYDNENWTKPSTATIWTSLLPETHKTKEDSSRLPSGVTTLSEHLQGQRFRTASFISNGYVSDAFGFKQGWHHYRNYIREERRTDADRVIDDAFRWVDKQDKDKRLFVYLHTIDPHVPYSPPQEFKKRYWDKPYRGWLKPQATGLQLADIKTKKRAVSKTDKAYLEALYNGEVTYNDHEFGRLIEGLKERGMYEDSVIVIVADHGEEFWDHGSVGHGHSLYEEMIHTPFFLRYPGRVPSGRRVPHVVSMVDLAPTLVDLLGLPAMEEAEGVTVTPTLDGVGEPRPYLAVSDYLYRQKAFRAGRYSWITSGTGGDLYDVVADPTEGRDVIAEHPIGQAYVRALAGQFLGARDKTAWWTDADREGKLRSFDADSIDAAKMDPELREQLEAMGYVDGARGDDDEDDGDRDDDNSD